MKHVNENTTKSLELVATVYESLRTRDISSLEKMLSSDVTWNVTEGFVYSGIYTGLNAVLHDFYGRFAASLSKLATEKIQWIDGGDHVVVLGYYLIQLKGSIEEHRIRFSHTWGIQDGKVTGVWQVADTAKLPPGFQAD